MRLLPAVYYAGRRVVEVLEYYEDELGQVARVVLEDGTLRYVLVAGLVFIPGAAS